MRIGHFMDDIWAEGGKASYILRVASAQAQAGHSVVLIDTKPMPQGETPPPGVQHSVAPSVGDLRRRAEEHNLDVVNAHEALPRAPGGRVAYIRTVHIHNPYCPSGTRYLSRWETPCDRSYSIMGCLQGHVVDRCGSVRPAEMVKRFRRVPHQRRVHRSLPTVAVSQFVKRQMVRSGYDGAMIEVIRSPAPSVSEPYVPPPASGAPPRFLFLGRLVPQKGIAWLLRAFAQVAPPLHLDIAGDGDQATAAKQMAERLGVQNRVTFHGWVDSTYVQRLIRAARAVVFPSVWHEPAGLVTLEAAAAGRAVIASRVGGIPEYASDDFATLVSPNDEEALARCLARLAADYDLAKTMGQRGRARVRDRFSMDQFLEKSDAFYARVKSDAAVMHSSSS